MYFNKGFTLLEIVIAVTIFSLAIALVSYSFRHSINIIRYVNFSYAEDLQKLSKLRDSITSTFFYLTQDDRNIDNPNKVFKFFFKGTPKSLEYITCKPLIIKNREIVLTKVYLKDNNIIVEEYPVYDKKMNYKEPSFLNVKPKKMVILTNIKNIKILYKYNGRILNAIDNQIPELLELRIQKENERKYLVFFFKIRSNAYVKKYLGASLYEKY